MMHEHETFRELDAAELDQVAGGLSVGVGLAAEVQVDASQELGAIGGLVGGLTGTLSGTSATAST